MSQSYSASSDTSQSEGHDPDRDQARKTDTETTTNKPSRTASEQINFWKKKVKEAGSPQDIAEDEAPDAGGLTEDWEFTPLHELLEKAEDDDDGSNELEIFLDQWEGNIDARSPEHQETALHMAAQKGFNKMACQLLMAGANVNIENGSGETPLHVACDYGDQQLVEMLLGKGADPERMDASGFYPLHSAVVRGFEAKVVRDLLGYEGSIINKTAGGAHWTPLNKAIYYKCEDVVGTLLEGGASVRIKDSDGWTPLMTAIKEGLYGTFHKLLDHLGERPTERDAVIIQDNDGMTPLMQLSAKEPGNLVKRAIDDLLKMGPDVNATDKEEKTALHHAIASSAKMDTGPDTDVALTLVRLLSVKRLLHPDKDGETAFDIAFGLAFGGDKNRPAPAFERLFSSLIDRLVQGGSIEELFCWAAYRLERHTFARDLFQKMFATRIPKDLRHDQWTVLEWAIYSRMPRVLLTYLQALGPEKRINEDGFFGESIKNGRSLIEAFKKEVQPTLLAERKRQKEKRGLTSDANSSKDAQVLRNMEDILEEILDYLYPEKAQKPTKPLELSKPEQGMTSSLNSFRAAIIQSNFVKFRTIQEVLYDIRSIKHIHDKATKLKQFEYRPSASPEQVSQANTRPGAQFTWIHLPSTNMTWMEDTAKKILKEEGCDRNEAERVASFLRSSWIEIPDRASTSRFMRPRYVFNEAYNATRPQAEEGNTSKNASERGFRQTGIRLRHHEQREESDGTLESDIANSSETEMGRSFSISATYMPYLYFSTYHQNESGEEMTKDQKAGAEDPSDLEKKVQAEIQLRQGLFKAYKKSVIHQPTTLDEFYYQFASDENSVKDQNWRNKDQVVTKYLQGPDIKKQRFWPLLRVSQLWVWTIDEKWLITSTSCANNNIRDNLVADILEHLRRQVENGSRQFGPTSATEMGRAIVDYCIGTYDRKRRRQTGGTTTQDQHQASTDAAGQSTAEDGKRKEERSIHQIFSDSINEIGRKESRFFSSSYRRDNDPGELETSLDAEHTSKKMKGLQKALKKVAKQLCDIKDIRDELNILKSIAAFQHKVQSTMAGNGAKEELSSYYLLRDIEELDRFADQTQEAVKTTLTLQESGIANWQASESFNQGKIVLVFTLVTVWFLPLSFLTSLFALDVASFMDAPAWAFYIIFLVPLIFLALAIVYVWKGDKIKDFFESPWTASKDYFDRLWTASKDYFDRLWTLSKYSGREAEGGTSTARFVPIQGALKRRNGYDVEHG
ncbi:hypothetical protein NCS52_00163600 [Fusarium sp. LHS14.1]|nr:hypothetical protein NCS52_00163600 [Fusarium sp. LHS14.1]